MKRYILILVIFHAFAVPAFAQNESTAATIDSELKAATDALNAKNYGLALEKIETIMKLAGRDPSLLVLAAECSLALNDHQNAQKYAEEAFTKADDRFMASDEYARLVRIADKLQMPVADIAPTAPASVPETSMTPTPAGEGQGGTDQDSENSPPPSSLTQQPEKPEAASVFFDYNRYNLRPDQITVLEKTAQLMKTYPEIDILIEGHCDERGVEEYNLALGESRAGMVRTYLVELGIDSSRITTVSYGESLPYSFGNDEASWSLNRRAQIWILPPSNK